ncbi:MAG: hypothetical protein ACT4N2_04655 [Hyphomicrobium sp.]
MQGLELTGLAGWIALSLPFLALLTVMALALGQIRRRRSRLREPASLTGRYGVPIPQPPSARDGPKHGAEPVAAPATPAAAATAVAALPSKPTREPIANVAERIAAAEARGVESELADLYLAQGRERHAGGESTEAAELFRRSIRLAAKHGQKQVHAAARLELGDLVGQQGDLTTACEHWQIARGLFYDLKLAGSLGETERRMRQNGCPTDWVLNDF